MRTARTAAIAIGLLVAGAAACGSARAQESTPSIRFVDAAERWGLDFRHHHGGSGERYMVETVVGGVVLFDFDLDGDVDAFFVDGAPLPGYRGEEPGSRLLRNDGDGRFLDVTARAEIELPVYGCGATAGDYDSDGDLDLYVTAFGANVLLENRGDGSFRDVTARAGVGDPLWSTSATFFDADLDGDLDLYVANYVAFTLETHKFCGDEEQGLQGYCHPNAYEGVLDRFYRNRGDGTFADETEAAGFSSAIAAGLGVIAGRLDDDRWPDLYVANDADPNFLFRGRGDGTFENVSLLSGTAVGMAGQPEGSMGIDLGDVDGDGRLDIVVTNFEFETNALYRNAGAGLFLDNRFAQGVAEASILELAFGIDLADFDQDGDLDLAVANGHILDNAREFDPKSSYAQANRILENLGDGRFATVRGAGLEAVRVSRGLASGDLDGDGDLDLAIVNSNDVAEIYENRSAVGSYVGVDLEGAAGNRFGIGARVEAVTESGAQIRESRTGSSYLSQNDLTLHFGLGASERVDLDVDWPSGRRQRFEGLPAGRTVRLFERTVGPG